MAKRQQYTRLIFLAVMLGLCFGGLGYRLVDLQVLRHQQLTAIAQGKTHRELLLHPRRGDILDSRGNVLATSVIVKTVAADPTMLFGRQAAVARAIAPLLQLDEQALYQRMQPRTFVNERGETNAVQYVVLKRRVPVEVWDQVRSALTNLSFGLDERKLGKTASEELAAVRHKAIMGEDEQMRIYPNQHLAVHVIGYANGDAGSTIRGREGIEMTFDSQLRGVPGWRHTERDRRGREVVIRREQDVQPQAGLTVVLTIDSVIQDFVEAALAEAAGKFSPQSITCVAVRPQTGEILAMATLPNYDPNLPGNPAISPGARRNRVLEHQMEPGSTFKTMVIASALSEGLVSLDDVFFCENGVFRYGGHSLRDSDGHRFGNLTVQQILQKSSNIGAAKIGMRLGPQKLYQSIRDFGFGSRSGLPLPAEVNPQVRPVKDWYRISIAQIPMGQGIAVTRMQMTMAMAAIANKGVLMQPMIVSRLQDREGNVLMQFQPQRVRQVISEQAAAQVTQALKTVVLPDGTAPKAAMELYTVAGKTGTAQKAGRGGYEPGKYVSSFIGFLPADNPEICISIVLEEPDPTRGYYGGVAAAPVFKQIAERAAAYLNVKPDLDPTPGPESLARTEAH